MISDMRDNATMAFPLLPLRNMCSEPYKFHIWKSVSDPFESKQFYKHLYL